MLDPHDPLDPKKIQEMIQKDLEANTRKGFKSNSKIYRKVFNSVSRQSESIDQFGGNYFCTKAEDQTMPVCVTLPKSLVLELNKYCEKKKVTRSRLVRKLIEYGLNLTPDS